VLAAGDTYGYSCNSARPDQPIYSNSITGPDGDIGMRPPWCLSLSWDRISIPGTV